MKRYLCLILTMCFLLTACGNDSSITEENSSTQSKETTTSEQTQSDGNILIAYFTQADNTVVEDEEAALESALSHYEAMGDADEYGDDVVASASILPPGNTARIASWIQDEIGGDLFSIQVEEPYPSDYDNCMDRAADEKAEDTRPVLKENVQSMDQYDTVFIGYPNWWYTCPMAIHSFIEENNLSGKRIVLFCTHGTGGLASSVNDIEEALPDDAVLEENVLGVYRPDVLDAQETVNSWLDEIGYQKRVKNMKKWIAFIMVCVLVLGVTACSQTQEDSQGEGTRETKTQNKTNVQQKETLDNKVDEEVMNKEIIIKSENGESVIFELNDSTAAESLYEQLPLSITIEDYSTNEKIFYPPEELDITDTPVTEVEIGTLAYYAPWEDVVMFYDTYQSNSSLYELGHVVSGGDLISSLTGTITIQTNE